MLNTLLRTAGVVALLCGSACQFSTEPNVGQRPRKQDAGSTQGEAQRPGRVSTAGGDVRSKDAEVDAEAEVRRDPAAGGAGGAGRSTNNGGAAGAKPAEQSKPDPKENQNNPPPDEQEPAEPQQPAVPVDAGKPSEPGQGDGGAELPALDAAVDSGARPTVDNPTGVLGDLANRTAGGKTAATINQFFETLVQGDAPAASIHDFLVAIDDEIDCVMNPFATECLAACQAVSTTCAVCVIDQDCRSTMLEICGYSALAGCVPRR